MTTPHQLPIDRAFVIGGETADGTTDTGYPGMNFGQNYTDEGVRGLFEIPEITLGNMVEVFTNLLLRIPLEALKIFAPIIPGGLDNFTDALTAVNAIVGSLTAVTEILSLETLQELTGLDLSSPEAFITSLLTLIGSFLGIPNLGGVLQQLALLPSLLLNAATGETPSDDENILEKLLDALRGIFSGETGEEDPTDVTPPTAPSLVLNSATYSTVTVTASGAIDP